LDASKAKASLNWRPVLPLKPALEWIVDWYRGFAQGLDLRDLTLAQISRYEALAKAEDSLLSELKSITRKDV
jgi:CDP-glucose 4,6-dehydratase